MCIRDRTIAARLHAIRGFNSVFQRPGGHDGDNGNSMACPLPELAAGNIAPNAALGSRAVSYTHLDVYKRQVHIRTLRRKLGSCGDYIQTVRGVGYKIGEAQ